MADLAWPDGVQRGRTQPVAFLLEPDEEIETRLSELGYRFFVTKDRLIWYLEEILGTDIDGDALIGATEESEGRSQADDEKIGVRVQESDLEERFHAAMVELYQRAKSDAGYNATLFLRMVSDHGGLETARRLITASRPSDGFTALWERGRLDLSVEAYALRPELNPSSNALFFRQLANGCGSTATRLEPAYSRHRQAVRSSTIRRKAGSARKLNHAVFGRRLTGAPKPPERPTTGVLGAVGEAGWCDCEWHYGVLDSRVRAGIGGGGQRSVCVA